MTRRGMPRRINNLAMVENEVARLRDLDLKALRLRWRSVTGKTVPQHLPVHLLRAIIAYRVQANAFGDLDAASARFLDKAASGKRDLKALTDKIDLRNQELLPGAILTREWNGRDHRVTVLENGFAWEGRIFDSLSKIAATITGTKWSGPRFFGLRSNVIANQERTSVRDSL